MKKSIDYIGCCLTWFAVITQLVLMVLNREVNLTETIVRFFSFFTILTNILVALLFTFRIVKPTGVFHKKATLTATTAFILIVGLVYQVALRGIWIPTGIQRLVDELLHSVIPLVVAIYWFIYASNEKSDIRNLAQWLLYPLAYAIFVLVRGYFYNYYPYPFFNIQDMGIGKVLLNNLLILMLIISVMFILIRVETKIIEKRTVKSS